MGAKAILFFISAMALLVTLSVVLNFWFYLLIAFAITIVVGSIVVYYVIEDYEERLDVRRDFTNQDFRRPTSDSRKEDRFERRLRNRVETEWENFDGENLR